MIVYVNVIGLKQGVLRSNNHKEINGYARILQRIQKYSKETCVYSSPYGLCFSTFHVGMRTGGINESPNHLTV